LVCRSQPLSANSLPGCLPSSDPTFIIVARHNSGTGAGDSTSTSTICSVARPPSPHAGPVLPRLLPVPLCQTIITAAGPKTSTTADKANILSLLHCWYLCHHFQSQYLRYCAGVSTSSTIDPHILSAC